jgi:hypothetical protein
MPRRRHPQALLAPVFLALGWLPACGRGDEAAQGTPGEPQASPAGEPAPESTAGAPLTGAPALAALRANVETTAARPEHTDTSVEVAHILVAFEGVPRIPIKGRTRDQAEQLAADLLARVQAGEDFEAVRVAHTDDQGGTTYKLSTNNKPGTSKRSQMVKGFGDVSWRLGVGEIGVAPHDEVASPFGWHIIKRLE